MCNKKMPVYTCLYVESWAIEMGKRDSEATQ